ncbi:MAG: GGDEF domain-containing protein, partial [Terracidiphilus sp.]
MDTMVRIRGDEAPLYNSNGLRIGARIVFPNLSAVQVVEPAPSDPFQSPVIPIDKLLLWDQVSVLRHRVHLRGSVTMQWPGVSLCIRDASGSLCAQTDQDTRLAIGDETDIVGFAGTENSTTVLASAIFRKMQDGLPVAAVPVTAEQAQEGKYNSEVIEIDGALIGRDLASSDTTLILSSGNFIFTAILPRSLAKPEANAWKFGSKLRITGVCSVQFDPQRSVLVDGVAVGKSFRVLMRSPQDVVVLERPTWWTPAHALIVLALALAGTLAVLVWVVVLRRRVQHQTTLLRESEERFRHMALHDTLTGLATRLLLDDRLNAAMETAKRHQSGLALLMVDLDKFKEVNDTFGHQAGDEVLRVTAERLVNAVRTSDTVARIGGDEFIVLLADLSGPQIAERIAAQIVTALALPICFEGREMPVSVSIGICAASAGDTEVDALMKNADAALYRAKECGRNCYQLFSPELAEATIEQTGKAK